MSHLRGKSVKEIHTVTTGELEIVECVIAPESKVVGKLLKNVENSGEFLVLMTKKLTSNEFIIANGETEMSTGDRVVLIAKSDYSKKVLDYIGGTN